MSKNTCFICADILSTGASRVIKRKSIASLIAASISREDNKHESLHNLESMEIHEACYKSYIAPSMISAERKRKRSQDDLSEVGPSRQKTFFNFTEKCVICGEDAGENYLTNKRKKGRLPLGTVHVIRNNKRKEEIINSAIEQQHKQRQEILNRISNIRDISLVNAKYHLYCFTYIKRPPIKRRSVGRPDLDTTASLMSHIRNFLSEHEEECQFSLEEILADYEGELRTEKWILHKLKEEFGSDLIITSLQNHSPILSFKGTGHKILYDAWYESRCKNIEHERARVVEEAANIILEDIRSKVYSKNKYPSPSNFFASSETDVPETLQIFLETIILNRKSANIEKWTAKILAIAHAIISAARPRCYLSPILIGLGSVLLTKYGSSDLIHLLSALGFCATYKEIKVFEISAVMNPSSRTVSNSFTQFVFDNVDHDICTLDGKNTLHAMAGIQCATPRNQNAFHDYFPRLKTLPSSEEIGKIGRIDLIPFNKGKSGLSTIALEDLQDLNPISNNIEVNSLECMWLYKKWKHEKKVPGWNGFMEMLTKNKTYKKSEIVYLPIIDAPASDYDTIHTALRTAVQRVQAVGQESCIVTFDLPLFIKARDIVASCGDISPLKNITVRLGGFHLAMSFIGCIGYIMAGSGLEDCCSLIYASRSVEKMLCGKAYARAIRCHSLIRLALATLIMEEINFSEEEQNILRELRMTNDVTTETLCHENTSFLAKKFNEKLQDMKKNGPTAELFVQYFEMVTVLLQFIDAEKCGNWKQHLDCIQRMLPFFVTSGHFNYAKCAYLYLQDMLKIYEKLKNDEYLKFTTAGLFTIRRSNKFYSGIWSDMTIEQTYMRNIHSREGLTHGRGVTPVSTARWITTIPLHTVIINQLEMFCNFTCSGTSHQHKDAESSRIERDEKDVKTLIEWFRDHLPFPMSSDLMSISTGIIGTSEINCHRAQSNGIETLAETMKGHFGDVKFTKRMKVLPLATTFSKICLENNDIIPVDPDTLFRRMLLFQSSETQLEEYFRYELAPYPLSIFENTGMRKNKKSDLYTFFTPVQDDSIHNVAYIIDGGYLLHQIVWNPTDTFSEVCNKYISHLKTMYGDCTVVFDGYPDEAKKKGTKNAERLRRSKHVGPGIQVKADLRPLSKPDKFFSNESNKKQFITFLIARMNAANISTKQATEDADLLIITTALEKSPHHENVVIVGQDIDLLVILSIQPLQFENVYFLKPGTNTTAQTLYNRNSFKHPQFQHLLGFVHAFSGCDTTSAFYNIGKTKFMKFILKNNAYLSTEMEVFANGNAISNEVDEAAEKITAVLYGAKVDDPDLAKIRLSCFIKESKKSTFTLSCLPPTSDAAKLHGRRVYYKCQLWQGHVLNPLDWGWKSSAGGLIPCRMTQNPAPQSLLTLISCKCTKDCRYNCGCKKFGIPCSIFCMHCQGLNCENARMEVDDDLQTDVDNEIDMSLEKN